MTDDLRALALAATPGPWTADGDPAVPRGSDPWPVNGPHHPVADTGLARDAAYIAAASPDRILALLDALDKANEQFGYLEHIYGHEGMEQGHWGQARRALDAALAAAKGES